MSSPKTWQELLLTCETRLKKFVADSANSGEMDEEDLEDAYEKGGKLSVGVLERIAAVACAAVRKAEVIGEEELAEAMQKASDILNGVLGEAYSNMYLGIKYFPSFAHTKETLLKDPMKGRMGGEPVCRVRIARC